MNLYQKMAGGSCHKHGGVRFLLKKFAGNTLSVNSDCNLHLDSNFLIYPRNPIIITELRHIVSKSLIKKNKWKYHVDAGKYANGIEFICRFGNHVIRGKSIHTVIKQSYMYSVSMAKLDASFISNGHFYYNSSTQKEMYNRHKSVYSWFNKPWRTE